MFFSQRLGQPCIINDGARRSRIACTRFLAEAPEQGIDRRTSVNEGLACQHLIPASILIFEVQPFPGREIRTESPADQAYRAIEQQPPWIRT